MKKTDDLTELDRKILNLIQKSFPLVETPFRECACALGTSEEDVIVRLKRLKEDKIIREVSAIFDTKSLGYKSSLVAMKIELEKIDDAALVINKHPGVSHNYKRNHEYNLWFTIAVPPDSQLGLEATLEILKNQSGALAMRMLPTLKLYKIGVKFDMTGKDSKKDTGSYYTEQNKNLQPLSEKDILAIRVLQRDLPLVSEPFKENIRNSEENYQFSVEELLKSAVRFKKEGRMRRFAGVLNHRKAGFVANAMGVWAPEADADVDKIGKKMASFSAVSHCYKRPAYSDWPYSIFTMVHGRNSDECEEILREISNETGVKDYISLYSTKEYKKTRLKYFDSELTEWEKRHSRHPLRAGFRGVHSGHK